MITVTAQLRKKKYWFSQKVSRTNNVRLGWLLLVILEIKYYILFAIKQIIP
jgi:hypothetical protein